MTDKCKPENLADATKIQKINDFFQMGRVIDWTSLQITAPCLSLIKLQTTCGTYCIKEYAVLKKKQLEIAGFLKFLFSTHQIPLNLSLYSQNERKKIFLYEDGSSCWSVTQWVVGDSLDLNAISITHVEQIAKILGKIHKLQVNFPEAPEVLSGLPDQFSHIGVERFQRKFEHHAELLKENLVISHGDLLPQNVIWEAQQKPVLIDWDNAGRINQDIDLFNTAINWAGIESGLFNQLHYDYFIESYLMENPRIIQIDKALVAASLGSWLNWLEFNHQQGNKNAVNVTLRSLDILEREFF